MQMAILFLILLFLAGIKAVVGSQKIFARTSLFLILSGSLFFNMMQTKSPAAALMGTQVANCGFYVALLMLAVDLNWRLDVWLYHRRRGRK
jgi:hypothetical protein